MEAKATLSGYRQAPRKVRLLANLVVGKKIDEAIVELSHRAKRAAPVVIKLLRSAVSNARNAGMNERSLVVTRLTVNKGSVLKRSMPRAHGRAFPIHKHTSHITVVLSDAEGKKEEEKMMKEKIVPAKQKSDTKEKAKKKTAKVITKKKTSVKAK